MSAGGYSRFIRVFIVKLSALCDSRADETSLKATEPKTKRNQEVRGLKAVTLREVQDAVIILCDFVSIGNSFHMVLFVHINVEDCSVDAWVKVLHQRIHRNCCYFK